jgi:hypothetical protein
MRKYKFISTLRFLNVTEPLKTPFTLMPGIDVINDEVKINEILDDELKEIAGTIEYERFQQSKHLIYCEFDETDLEGELNSNQALQVWMLWIHLLLQDSWIVKDNNITCDIAYMKMTKGSHEEWSNNYFMSHVSLSSGHNFKESTFNITDMKEWERKSNLIQGYLHTKNSGAMDSFTDKNFSRIGRSLKFVYAARKELHPAIKISHYCSAFESLFSTDNSELTHKLSERIAIFFKVQGWEPIKIFDEIKALYSIRSKVSHGDSISKNKEKHISELSQKADKYLRAALNVIFLEEDMIQLFDGSKEKFDEYFKVKLLCT